MATLYFPLIRTKLVNNLTQALGKDVEHRYRQPTLVYDLDARLTAGESDAESRPIEMIDVSQINEPPPTPDAGRQESLRFESRFESGNLRRVFQVRHEFRQANGHQSKQTK